MFALIPANILKVRFEDFCVRAKYFPMKISELGIGKQFHKPYLLAFTGFTDLLSQSNI